MNLRLRQLTNRRRDCHLGGMVVLFLVLLMTVSYLVLDDRQIHTILYRSSTFLKFMPEVEPPGREISEFTPEVALPGINLKSILIDKNVLQILDAHRHGVYPSFCSVLSIKPRELRKCLCLLFKLRLPEQDLHATSQPFQPHTLWILPTMAPSGNVDIPEIVDLWGVFVPTELKKSFSANCKNCYNEDQHKHMALLYDVTEIQRSDPFSDMHVIRKMAALLFLMKEKTQGILQTSDHSSVVKSIERFFHDNQPYGVSGLEYFSDELMKDSAHYLFHSGRNYTKPCQYRIRYKMNPLWTVGVRCLALQDEGLPDKVSLIDPHSPPVFVSRPKFSIETFSDSYFSPQGFWAMFASLFDADIEKTKVLSLWAQRMTQEIGGEIAVTPLPCPPNRKVRDTKIEPDTRIKQVFDFVKTWNCGHKDFNLCSEILVQNLQNLGYITADDVILHRIWFQGLSSIGYAPKRVSKKTVTNDVIPYCVMHTPALITPPSQKPKPEKLFPNLEKPCQIHPQPPNTIDPFLDYNITKPSKVKDIALIVIFYTRSYYHNNMPKIYDMYNKYFPNFIFCGPDYNHFSEFQQTFRKPVGFIEVQDTHAFIAQDCMTRAMTMHFDVRGYLQFADDNLMNTWAIGDLPRDRLWFQHEVLIASRMTTYIQDFFLKVKPWAFWKGWKGVYGQKGMQHVWDRFDAIAKEDNVNAKEIVESFRGTLQANSGDILNFYYQASDVFYVPARLRRQWTFLADIFSVNNVFLEIAIPTLIYGMDKFDNVLKMAGNYLWYEQRPHYLEFYKFDHHFQHPWKMSWMKNQQDNEFLCYGVLVEIVKERTIA